jgi:type I restriction enzyme S subunit
MNNQILLNTVADYSDDRVNGSKISEENFVTTDSMLQGKNGIKQSTVLPKGNLIAFKKGDILIGNIRPYLKKIWHSDRDGGCSPDVLVIRPKNCIDSKFLFYSLFRDDFFLHMMNGSKGTKMPRGDKKQIFRFQIPDFEIFGQQKIAKVLSILDAKIRLNNRIIVELESMAKTIYDYWFVQFDFPNEKGEPYKSSGGKMVWNEELKREIPEVWEVCKLGEIGNFKNGVNYDPSNPGDVACPIINVRNISSSSYFIKNEDLDVIYLRNSDVKKYSVHNGSIIIARSGIPGATRLIADIAENTLYCGFAIHYELDNLDFKIPVFFYLKSIEYQIQNGSGGTIMKNVNQATLNALSVCLPKEKNLLENFNKLIQPIFDKISLIQIENQKQVELRDWLLPMLMNGQVKVN